MVTAATSGAGAAITSGLGVLVTVTVFALLIAKETAQVLVNRPGPEHRVRFFSDLDRHLTVLVIPFLLGFAVRLAEHLLAAVR